jgi:hypothetical protein
MTAPLPEKVIAAVLFGSQARGDFDTRSDRDLCVIFENVVFDEVAPLVSACAMLFGLPEDNFTAFTRGTAELMADAGSLFLLHLKNEGIILSDRGGFLAKLFCRLRAFDGHCHELALYRDLLSDVYESLESTGQPLELDLHILQLIVRNTCLLLTHAAKEPCFSRRFAYDRARALFPRIPLAPEAYDELSYWHLKYERGTGPGKCLPSTEDARRLARAVDETVAFAREAI